MSDQGWRDFLAAENVGDWVVVHGGATAVFLVSSLGDAVRLADAVAQVPGIEGAGVLITVAAASRSWRVQELVAGSVP